MKKFLYFSIVFFAISAFSANAQVLITNAATPYTQDFNSLALTGSSNVLPTGWVLGETGSNANDTYQADAGGASAGNSYSYGDASSSERALGSIRSGSLLSSFGVNFVNNSGSILTSITVSYIGEQWRLGTISRKDTIQFQYSLDATDIVTGTWVDENNLDFTTPAIAGPIGSYNGNAIGNKTALSFTISGLSIPNGASFWLKWVDGDATGAEDGLAIDDVTVSFNSVSIPPCAEPVSQPTALLLTPTPTSISGSFTAAAPAADEYLVIRSTASNLSSTPTDGVAYIAGQALGNGVVVATGTATTFTDQSLTPNTPYYYFVFAVSSEDCIGGPNYLTVTPLSNNASTLSLPLCAVPTASPTNPVLTPSNNTVTGSFTAAAGANRYLVVRSSSSSLGTTPVNGVTYTPGQALGNGTVISYGSSTSFVSTGLNPGILYYFIVFAVSGDCSGEPAYRVIPLVGNVVTTNTSTGIPPGYYNTIFPGLNCAPLKTALKNIISANTIVLTYTPGVLTSVQTTDIHRNDANTADIVWDMYSDNPTGPEPYTYTYYTDRCGDYTKEGDCYNREHSFPQLWFGNGVYPMFSDIHHIFPTDGMVNGKKANFAYGEVAVPEWTSANGGKLGPCSFPGFSGTVFEPINAYKGDFARAQLYMITRYEDSMVKWKNNGNANDVLNGTSYPSLDDWYIKLLYKWHIQDPVSQKEIDRNNAIYAIQGNRNPYIDHPEYVPLLFQCTVIPVTLLDIKATKENGAVTVEWYTTRETNFKNYEVERSTDGIHFEKIGIVAGQNLSSYSLKDNKLPAVKMVYYRLRMIDIDGKATYSKVVSVRLGSKSVVLLYPNPAKNSITIKLEQAFTVPTELKITDVAGRTVVQQTITIAQTIVKADLQHLPPGRYFVSIKNDATLINESFMIVR